MIATLSGAILNVVLDPIAIFALGWGVKGAAIATAVGQVLSAGRSLWYLARRMHAVRLNRDCFRLWPSLMKHYLPLGLCSLWSQMSMVIAMGFTQTALRTHGSGTVYGADIPLTVIGIVCKFLQIVMSVVIGVAAGCIPVVGYNIGAGRKDRVREVLKRMMLCEAAVGFAALALFQLFPRQLISLFGSENELYLSFAERAFRIYLGMVPLACVNKAAFIFLQAMGKPVASTFLSFLREVVLAVPLVLLLPVWLGLDGVLYSMPLADLIACAASAWVLVSVHKELKA
jgi:Na+-driven multidrug efflux pump